MSKVTTTTSSQRTTPRLTVGRLMIWTGVMAFYLGLSRAAESDTLRRAGTPIPTEVCVPEDYYRETRGFPPDLMVYFDELRFRAIGLQSDIARIKDGMPGRVVPARRATNGGVVALEGAFETDDITRTDLGLNYSFRWNAFGKSMEIFIQPEVINLFNEDLRGAGVQHLALTVKDIIDCVRELRARGIEFMPTPGTYYDALPERLERMGVTVLRDALVSRIECATVQLEPGVTFLDGGSRPHAEYDVDGDAFLAETLIETEGSRQAAVVERQSPAIHQQPERQERDPVERLPRRLEAHRQVESAHEHPFVDERFGPFQVTGLHVELGEPDRQVAVVVIGLG